jgi:glutathione synthase/RimK-type ligase-like ATP-grasp enzyme
VADGTGVRITIFHSPQQLIRIHPSYVRHLPLASGATCRCSCGRQTIQAQVLLDPTVPTSCLMMSTELANRVLLDVSPTWVTARIDASGIVVGPTVGILCNPRWNQKRGNLFNSKQLPVLEKLVGAGREAGALVYIFSIQDVDFSRGHIRGYVHNNGQWQPAQMPFPDAIYDQVISRKVERQKTYLEKREQLSRIYGVRIFNDGFFDKWQVHEWLLNDFKMKAHIPNTSRYTHSKGAASFIRNHHTTFLKPIHGSLGLGIVKVTRLGDGVVTYEVKRQEQRVQVKVASPEAAAQAMRGRLNSRPYLMQEGITLAMYQDRPFDVRIVLQRDGSGEWKRTKMFARVAKPGEFTSNISSGGEALPVSKVLEEVYTSLTRRRRCSVMIRKVSMAVTNVIETQSKKQFGELGIDVGVDDHGHVWIIEVNSKPWKSPTTEKGRQDLVDLGFTRPMQYAIHLSQKQ